MEPNEQIQRELEDQHICKRLMNAYRRLAVEARRVKRPQSNQADEQKAELTDESERESKKYMQLPLFES